MSCNNRKKSTFNYGFTVYFIIAFSFINAQVENTYLLGEKLNETSGLEFYENMLITHNDSGNNSCLYFLNLKGAIKKELCFDQIENIDWEDVTIDDKFFYVSDSGNNYDTRKNLKILKFALPDFELKGEIKFKYPEQLNFDSNSRSQFDAEGLVTLDDQLILFTKNRKFLNTQIYSLPKTPGNFEAQLLGEIDTDLIITGADYNQSLRILALTGTKDFKNYRLQLYEIISFSPPEVILKKEVFINQANMQVEGVKLINSHSVWLSSEDETNSGNAKLLKVKF